MILSLQHSVMRRYCIARYYGSRFWCEGGRSGNTVVAVIVVVVVVVVSLKCIGSVTVEKLFVAAIRCVSLLSVLVSR